MEHSQQATEATLPQTAAPTSSSAATVTTLQGSVRQCSNNNNEQQTTKVVTFKSNVLVKRISHYKTYTKQRRRSTWYTQHELDAFRECYNKHKQSRKTNKKESNNKNEKEGDITDTTAAIAAPVVMLCQRRRRRHSACCTGSSLRRLSVGSNLKLKKYLLKLT